ncbi:dihydroorotase [Candidatus Peregrinibacteria bacterium]|nr:dihydroorotase [Candidatus Peregrinibacteria bacterium]
MPNLLIRNGRVLDPETRFDGITDIVIKDGKISDMGDFGHLPATPSDLDATGKLVIPGVIDLHVHLRDLEQSYKETIESGTLAALRGGVTTVFAMPNTKPSLDSVETIERYQSIIRERAAIHVHLCGAITQGLKGAALTNLDRYPGLGIRMVTDDGFDVNDESLLEQAYAEAKSNGLLLMTHPEMNSIAPTGVMNDGEASRQLGVPGQPNEKEWRAVERGIRLARKTGGFAHFTHLSTKESVELVRQAKKTSDMITCDTTPHHLCLTDELVLKIGGMAKVNPPLRTEADRQALIEGIKDGTIDCLVTDHAPHSQEEKEKDVVHAAFGFTGLETFVPAVIQELYYNQKVDLVRIIELLTSGPATVSGLESGRIQIGAPADLTIIDLNLSKTVRREELVSKGKNTPFHGMTLKGWPVATILNGEVKRRDDSLLNK